MDHFKLSSISLLTERVQNIAGTFDFNNSDCSYLVLKNLKRYKNKVYIEQYVNSKAKYKRCIYTK